MHYLVLEFQATWPLRAFVPFQLPSTLPCSSWLDPASSRLAMLFVVANLQQAWAATGRFDLDWTAPEIASAAVDSHTCEHLLDLDALCYRTDPPLTVGAVCAAVAAGLNSAAGLARVSGDTEDRTVSLVGVAAVHTRLALDAYRRTGPDTPALDSSAAVSGTADIHCVPGRNTGGRSLAAALAIHTHPAWEQLGAGCNNLAPEAHMRHSNCKPCSLPGLSNRHNQSSSCLRDTILEHATTLAG